ncbi:MAG: ABC transporter ATP-binding protein [Thermoguttaceae bacterium]|nr:ABC transporter ATP-binding protein [Thermoguttaceae bacterium]MDW8039566.1 ABC transporter ATP-binding protein [Thermoguttaceae bacterium]
MDDSLESLLRSQGNRPSSAPPTPRLAATPRVQGGPCLDGAPKLESLGITLPSPAGPGTKSAMQAGASAGSSGCKPAGASGVLAPSAGPVRLKEIRSPLERSVRPVLEPDGQKKTGPLLCVQDLHKLYHKGPLEIRVLRGVNLTVEAGEFVAIVGQSGSGKSTLLHLIATLDTPTQGQILFEGRRIDSLPAAARDRFRNSTIGIIFQFYHLLPELDTLENVLMPLMIAAPWWRYWRRRRAYREAAIKILQQVGLADRLHHKPSELSGGEMQRAAIARALITQPKLLLADEPTGNLDRQNGQEILQLLRFLNQQHRLTILMVSHDPEIAAQADRVVRLVDGCIHPA